MATFLKLTRPATRALKPNQSISEQGITFTRTANGDGRWSVNVMVARRRHHQVVGLESEGYTRTQAEDVVAALKAAKRSATHGVQGSKGNASQTVAQAADDYLDYLRRHDGKDIDTKKRRFRDHIKPHLGRRPVARLTDDDWLAYVATRKGEGASPGTINRERSALLHMLNTMRRRKILAAAPLLARQREPQGKLVYLTPEESQRLLLAAQEDLSPLAHRFVMVTLYTGLRHSAALNLRASDVDAQRRILWIGKDKAGRREQPMPQVLADYLAQVIEGLQADDFLFPSARAGSGRAYQMNAVFARCVRAAGITKHVTPHTMRHTAATNAAHAGLDAATIQAMGGWKTRAMAERYTHAASMQDAMAALQQHLSGDAVTPELPRPPRKRA
ncbi:MULTISPECIES: tyrosine-type recombinase/integrase [Stenotrophomonas]|jgi:integrase/recombinase XerD|uniref:tyrosine-type recombinase/integrase n=1 Tax=Stenotrophomonas TaxID=40323 RepID=UPI0013128F48|nr:MULTISPECIES: tyrosine-type recombinase/integrase [Stenotrophomonas]HEL7615151.1 tyrosine-type recombinase/integrase [Stenotrophomonas maltophilia]HEL7762209.1 tyrosine-type recombinase/integrase [Stenotrophomonas maltophilia]